MLVTGVLFLLVILPFTFIEIFYAPWMKAQESAKAPQRVPAGMERHVILTRYGPVAQMLVRMLDEHGYPHVVLVPTVEEALELREQDMPIVVGDRTDPETYRRLALDKAAVLVTTLDDVSNTNVTFIVRELSDTIPIVASATADQVRDGLLIAEASPAMTPLVGRTIAGTCLRAETGVTVVGLWVRGHFEPVDPGNRIDKHSMLVLAGGEEHFAKYNEIFGRQLPADERGKVVIARGGRVGRATSRALTEAGIPWTIIERIPERVRGIKDAVIGDAADFEILVKAKLQEAVSVIVTTHDDDMNVYLTIFYRRLRHALQIISRCTHEQNASRLHRAGADLTLSYASMGANTIFNHLRGSDTVLLAEGVNIFTTRVPSSLAGKTLAESAVRSRTGCSIIALETGGKREINPDPSIILPKDAGLVLIGSLEAETRFREAFKFTARQQPGCLQISTSDNLNRENGCDLPESHTLPIFC